MSILVWLIFVSQATGQSLATANLSHWYDGSAESTLSLQPVKWGTQLKVYYCISVKDSLVLDQYALSWEKRSSFNQRDGETISPADSSAASGGRKKCGVLTFDIPAKPWLLVAKLMNTSTQLSWLYYTSIDGNWPVNGWISGEGGEGVDKVMRTGSEYRLHFPSDRPVFGFFYHKGFMPSLPPFSTSAPSDPFMKSDSSFAISGVTFSPKSPGLYLFQQDSTSAQGITVVAVDSNFPKYTRLEKLAPPLIYITTQEEFADLSTSSPDKAKFDKVILGITRDKDRARNFMRSYFQRVETANRFFTSFKEGWKTDRGMIYIVFGKPDEVSRSSTNEIWFYKSSKARFVFVRSGSIFDPEHYVMMRDDRYTNDWFSTIDLWRKSRF